MLKKLLVLFIALSVGFSSTIDIRAMVEDTTPPMVTGVEEGGIYKAPVTIGFDEGIAVLNDVEIANPTMVSELGEYVLVVTDQSNNVTTVHFSLVDGVAPMVTGVTQGASYTDPVTITFDEGTATLNGNAFVSGSLVSAHGAYTLVVTDEHDNVTTVSFSIVAKTAAISGLKVVNAGYNSISLSWTAMSNVTGYEIWRSTGTSTSYTLVTSTVTTNSYVNTGLAFNTKYNYKVRVFTLINNVKVYGAFSIIGSATTALTTPVTSVVSASYNSIKVSWAAIPGVSGYQVYRATSLAGTYTLLTSTTATSYTNSLLTTNTLYYYKVRGYRTVGTLKYYSAYSTVLSARPIPSQVIGNTVVSTGYNSLKASWAAVVGATGYEVYKSSSVDGTYVLVLTTGLTYYSFSSLPTNVPLFVKVRAYRLVGTVKVYGAFSTIQSSSPIPSNPAVTLTSLSYKSLKLSWAAVSGATGYEVYHREGENYVLVQESSALSLTVDNLVSGVTHDYKVIAYRMEGETKVYSKETLISGKALPSVPSVSSLVNYNTIKLKWNEVEGAMGYEVHRATTATGTYTVLSTVSALEYNHLALAFNTTYYYKVRAYALVNDVKVYGNFTGVLTIKTNVAAPVVTAKSASYVSTNLSWPAVSGASGYEVSRATVLAGPYTILVSATSATSYTNSALTTNTLYYYRVRSYRLVGTVKYYSAYSTVVSVRPVPAIPTGVSLTSVGYDSARLGWVAVTGATGYEVLTSDALGGTYTLKTTTSSLSATISGLPTNVLVYAKVRAYRLVGTTKVYGDYSAIVNVAPIPAKPVVTVGNLSHTSIKVSWPLIAGADGYEVYHLVGSDYVLVQDNNEISLTVNELVSGEVHTYKVIAYRMVNEAKVYSQETIASGKAFPLTPVVSASINYASIQLNWATVEGASGYEVVRSSTSTGTYALIATVTTNGYLNSGLAFNTTYYYKVRAYALVNDVKVYGNYTGILTYKTNVAAPVVTAKSASYVSTNLSWPAVSGASGYEISRATVLAGPYTVLVSATSATSYTNSALTTNTLYYYRVRSYRLVGTVKYYSAYSTVVSVRPVPAVPTGLALVSTGHDSVKATWTAVTGATGYEVHTSDAQDGTYTLKATVTTNTATVSGYPTMVPVYVKVRAYRLVGTVKAYGGFNAPGAVSPVPSKPTVSTSYPSATSAKLTWGAVPGATSYVVMLFISGNYTLISTQSELDFTLTDLEVGQTYLIQVIAVKALVGGGQAESDATNVTVKPLPPTPVNVKASVATSTSVNVSWSAVEGAYGYEMQRATSSTGTYTVIGTTREIEYLDSGLVFNSTYYYKVRAYAMDGTTKVYGSFSLVVSTKTTLPAPVETYAQGDYNFLNVSFSEVSGAEGYEISRSLTSTGTFTIVNNLPAGYFFQDTNVTAGVTYYYRVRAYKTVSGVKVYSAYTPVFSGRPIPVVTSTLYNSARTLTSNTFTWGATWNAFYYEVVAAKLPSTNYTVVYSGTGTTFTHTGLVVGDYYHYKLRTYVLVNGIKVYSDFSYWTVTVSAGVPKPVLEVVENNDKSISFIRQSTDALINRTSIYEIDPITNERTLVTTLCGSCPKVEDTRYTSITGRTVTYVAVSESQFNGVWYQSVDSEIMTITTTNPPVEGLYLNRFSKTEVVIMWDSTSNTVEVYRSESIDGEYIKIDTINTWIYFDRNVVLGKTYFYKVRRLSTDFLTGETVASEFSPVLKGAPGIATYTFSAEVLSPYDVEFSLYDINYDGATGAELCEVDENYTILSECIVSTESSLIVTDFEPDTTYNFARRNFLILPDGSTLYSAFSQIRTFTTAKEPDLNFALVGEFNGKTTVTIDITNTVDADMTLTPNPTMAFNLLDPNAEIHLIAKDSSNVAITNYILKPGLTKRLTFTLTTTGYTFNDNLYITFVVTYDQIAYIVFYNPYDGVYFMY